GTEALHTPSPLVLIFHGATFGAEQVSEWAQLQLAWPEATVVYPRGISLSSPWQVSPGEREDHDLHFVDALLKGLAATYRIDERRVFVSGISYGGFFVNLLLTMRPEPFAAFAPLATADPGSMVKLARVPRPVLITHGKLDTVISILQGERLRDQWRRLN